MKRKGMTGALSPDFALTFWRNVVVYCESDCPPGQSENSVLKLFIDVKSLTSRHGCQRQNSSPWRSSDGLCDRRTGARR